MDADSRSEGPYYSAAEPVPARSSDASPPRLHAAALAAAVRPILPDAAMMRGIPVVRDLCRASLALYEELVHDEKLKFFFEQRGALYVNSTAVGFEKSRRDVALRAEHGLEVRILTGREAHGIEPAVLESAAGACYYPEDAHGDSHLFVTSLGARLPNLGV